MSPGSRLAALLRKRAVPSGPPQAFGAGEFYSPIVDAAAVLTPPEVGRIWPAVPDDPPGIDLDEAGQLELLGQLSAHRMPVPSAADGPAYDPENDQFPPHDAAVLYALISNQRPGRMVEVGCGWSTTVTAAAIRDGAIGTELTCIEPYPRSFLHEMGDVLRLRQEKVEHTPLEVFERLGAGDVLFIDSSHVVKTGSDVAHLFLQVLPRLAPGVVVHVHDIFIPEDYPQGWVRNGFNWNEQYVLQAYLSGNPGARVLCANRWLALRHPDAVVGALGPMALTGSSFWFKAGSE